MRIAIIAPVYVTSPQHLDLMKKMLASIHSDHHDIRTVGIINKYTLTEPVTDLFDLVQHNTRNCLASAWNQGIDLAFRDLANEAAIIVNTDIAFHENCIDALCEFYSTLKDRYIMLSGASTEYTGCPRNFVVDRRTMTHNYSCFMVGPSFVSTVGYFDTNFKPAYMEDCDMQHRIEISGNKHMCLAEAKFDHFEGGNNTIKNDKKLMEKVKGLLSQREYFIKKWGSHERAKDLWDTPFNLEPESTI